MGPLALMAKEAGLEVFGSDMQSGPVTQDLVANGVQMCLGVQDGEFLKSCAKKEGLDWFVYTSALPGDHPELEMAKKLKLKISKRDEFISYLVKKLKLKMIAVAGTHGKTTTSAMIIWAAQQMGLPLSYLVGTTLPFGPAGHYDPKSEYIVYEADEYDRNFLAYHPWLAVIPVVSYDHPDIYPTLEDYQEAFRQFEAQSETVLHGQEVAADLTLPGETRRYDATLALDVMERILPKPRGMAKLKNTQHKELVKILNNFPGVGRRFEQVSEGYYSDYAHHPEEVAATVEIAREEAHQRGMKGVVAIYEPHQNIRQIEIIDGYKQAFEGLDKLYWVPTFLTREKSGVRVIEPQEFIETLDNKKIAETAELDDELAKKLIEWHEKGYLILLMSAGSADAWLRKVVYATNQESAAQHARAPRSADEEAE